MRTRGILYLLWLMVLTASCSSSADNDSPTEPPADVVPSLKEKYAAVFPMGTAGSLQRLEQNQDLVTRHFNRLTAEYEMKWGALQTVQGRYDFTRADRLIQFAETHGMKVTGHTMIWHADTPKWVFAGATKETLSAHMKTYIETVGQHFRGKVDSWDVVNEVLADDANTYRDSPYYRIFGSEAYIADAYRWAAAADPDAELWYNDYNIEAPAKLEKLLTLIRYLKSQGIKLTGIGFQAHTNLQWPYPAHFEQAFQKVIAEGLRIKISEIDMSIYSDYSTGIFSPETAKVCDGIVLQEQARRYGELFKIFRRYKEHIAHVTFWGFGDDATWLDSVVSGRKDCPLLFDARLNPKPAFDALMNF